MSKYEPLRAHLVRQNRDHVPMSFEEIERLIGSALPPSARRHRAWWSNNPTNSVITHAWLDAGYRSEAVNLETGRLLFRRDDPHATARPAIFGCMKGTVTLRDDVDLTEPTAPDWGLDAADGARG